MPTNQNTLPIHHTAIVEDAWIDYNGHMNVAYYTRAFDLGTEGFLEAIGFGAAWRERENKTMMAVESHVVYEREAHVGDHLDVSVRMVDHDDKRVHVYCQMFDREEGHRAATCEWLMLQVDFAVRRATQFNDDERARLAAAQRTEAALGPIEGAGRSIGLKKQKPDPS